MMREGTRPAVAGDDMAQIDGRSKSGLMAAKDPGSEADTVATSDILPMPRRMLRNAAVVRRALANGVGPPLRSGPTWARYTRSATQIAARLPALMAAESRR